MRSSKFDRLSSRSPISFLYSSNCEDIAFSVTVLSTKMRAALRTMRKTIGGEYFLSHSRTLSMRCLLSTAKWRRSPPGDYAPPIPSVREIHAILKQGRRMLEPRDIETAGLGPHARLTSG